MTPPEPKPVMEVHNVRKAFRGHRGLGELLPWGTTQETVALDDVSFRLERGRVLGLVGESGSGKSTLANILVALERPTGGRVLFDGTDLWTMSNAARRLFHRHVQMVFQDPYASLNPRFTVRRTVEEPLAIHRYDRWERLDRVIAALEQSELRPGHAFLGKYPHELSGGQRQRVAIARAIVLEPDVLIADEPVSMLDVSVRAGILRLLRSLVDRTRMALVFITHDLSLIGQLCDSVAVLYRGRICEFGPADAVLDRPMHPYTRLMISAVPVPDPSGAASGFELPQFETEAASGRPPGCSFAPRCAFAVDRCRAVVPPLRDVGALREAACHRAEELPTGAPAARGRTHPEHGSEPRAEESHDGHTLRARDR